MQYTLTIIRISGGMFRGTQYNGQVSERRLLEIIGGLPQNGKLMDIAVSLNNIEIGKSITMDLTGDDQHWICYISNITK